jgi:hypothetical protein
LNWITLPSAFVTLMPVASVVASIVPLWSELVDELGGKGLWRVGDALISPKHGNFMINTGNATASHVLGLMQLVQTRVFEATGHMLHPENKLLGYHANGQHAPYLTLEEVALYQELTR